jgi:hypothetical protein
MKILVDGRQTREIGGDAAGLAAAYRETITGLAVGGRTVVKVSADGRELSNEQQEEMLSGTVLPRETLAFESEDTRELAANALGEVGRHFDPLRSALSVATQALGRSEGTKAFEALRPALEIWLATSQAVHQVVILTRLDTGGEGIGADFAATHRRTVGVFGEVLSTFQQEDWVRLNDLLEYELLPLVDEWENVVRVLQNSMRSDSQA